jgi:hypothetical protein
MHRALMNPTTMVLRWYRQSTGQALTHKPYTAQEVLQLLRSTTDAATYTDEYPDDGTPARSAAVRQVAAQPAAWLGAITMRQRQEIGALADRLPSLVFHHAAGGEPADLLRRFGGWSTWRYEQALEVAGLCIASCLNASTLT